MKPIFLPAICLSCFLIGTADAQSTGWSFASDAETGIARWGSDATTAIEFRCARDGEATQDTADVEWWLRVPDLVSALAVAEGEVAQVALHVDGAASGSGPFVRQGDAAATRIERGSPVLQRLRAAGELGLGPVERPATVKVPLAGFGEALDRLVDFCTADSAPEASSGPGEELVDCSAPESQSEETICNAPDLRALEARLAAAVAQRRDSLEGPPREAFMADHAAWEGLRRSCGSDVACLTNATNGRIAFLGRDAATPEAQPAVALAPAADTGPPALEIVPVQPLQPSQLGSVLYDPRQITQRVILEMVRQQPALLDNDQVLQSWYRVTLGDGRIAQSAAERAQGRDHLSRSVAAQPPGPFLIAHEAVNPFANGTYEQGTLTPRGYGSPGASGDLALGRFQASMPGLGSVDVRATSQYDIGRLQVDAAQAQMMVDTNLRLLIVAEVSRIHVVGSPETSFAVLAEGQVRFAGLKRQQVVQAHGRSRPIVQIDPTTLVANFAPSPPSPPAGGLAGTAEALGIPMYQGAAMEGAVAGSSGGYGNAGLQTLVRLAALRAHPPETIGESLRAFTFNVLAGAAERDQVIPPVNIEPTRNADSLTFSRHVDEFDRAELEDRLDSVLWPRVQARLPMAPFDGIVLQNAHLGEYDRARGGFPLQVNVGSMGLAAQGSYPALKSLPDLLPLPVEKARELVDYFDSTFGPGNRRAMMVLKYRVADIGPADWNTRQLPVATIEPVALSLHAYNAYQAGEDPFRLKIMDFDLAAHRGAPPPVASAERVAFWKEIREVPRSTQDDLALAAIGVSRDDAYLEQVVEESPLVRSASDFDRPAAREAMRARISSAERPAALVLNGEIELREYSVETEQYRSTRLYLRGERGEMGLRPPEIRFADTSFLSTLDVPEETARILAGDSGNAETSAGLIAWVVPDLLTMERGRPVLYVTPTRIVVRPNFEDATGYPPAHVDVALPERDASAPGEASIAELTVDPPTSLPLDSEYVDLLMVQRRGDDLREATYLRMLEDRRLREAAAATLGMAAPWGQFFDDPVTEPNPLQRRNLLPGFIDWTRKRAELLPDTVYLQTTGYGMIPTEFRCWTLTPPPQDNYADILPEGLAGALDAMDYRKRLVHLSTFARSVGGEPHREPETFYAIYGRPSLLGTSGLRVDGTTRACAGSRYRNSDAAELQGAEHWSALVSVTGAFRSPLSRDGATVFRDLGRVEIAELGPDSVRLTLTVDRTEVLALVDQGGRIETVRSALLDEDALPEAPAALDIFGVSPGDEWAGARALAQERLPDAVVVEADGPPQNFRLVTQNTILGPMPEFNALRNGHVFLDEGRNEVLALLREAERDPDRVLAVASYRRFAAGQVTQQQLIGALLRKYGAAPRTESDPSLHGARPGQTLSWGARAGCLPQMRDEVRPDWTGHENRPNLRELQNLARMFRAPSLSYNGAHSIVFERCTPTVWAFVGEDRDGMLHLVVWSFDLALLDEVAQKPDPQAKADGDSGSKALIDDAAEIDL